MTRDTVHEARLLGLTHGWKHAAWTDAYGPDTRDLAEIKDAMRAGGYDSEAERAAYSDGFDEGMTEFTESAGDYDENEGDT